MRGIIDGITESHVIPSVLQLEPCSQRKQPLKTGLDKVGIRSIQIRAKFKILGAKIVARPKAQPHYQLSEPEIIDLGAKINL